MAIRPLCVMPHQRLRTVAAPIPHVTTEVRALVEDLIETMHAHHGVGLAAPQMGCSLQAFVVNLSQRSGDELVVMNPVLDQASGCTAILEGCLSLPDVWEEVPRWASVRLSGKDASGKPFSLKAEGLLAIVIQHEVDHLHGRLFIDRVPGARRQRRVQTVSI